MMKNFVLLKFVIIISTFSGYTQINIKKMYGIFSPYSFELIEDFNNGHFILSNHNYRQSRHTFFKIDMFGEPYGQNYYYQSVGGSLIGSHRLFKRTNNQIILVGKQLIPINASVIFVSVLDSSLQYSVAKKFYDVNTGAYKIDSHLNIDSTLSISGAYFMPPFSIYPFQFKLSSDFGIAWSRVYTDRAGYVHSVAESGSQGHFLLMQLVSEGLCLSKTDSSGNIVWSKSITSPNRYASGMRLLPSGDLVIYGYMNPGNSTGYSTIELFITKIDTSGNLVWSKKYGDSTVSFFRMGPEPDMYMDTVSENRMILTGGVKLNTHNYVDMMVMLLDTTGNVQWARRYGNDLFDEIGTIVHQRSDGGFIIGGYNSYSPPPLPPDPFGTHLANVTVIKTDSIGYSDGCMEYPLTVFYEPDTPLVTDLTWSIYVDSIVTEIPYNLIDTTGVLTRNENMCTFVSLMEPDGWVERLDVFPNPSEGVFIVQSAHTIDRVEVSDITGRKILSKEYLNSLNVEVNLTGQTPGVYLAKIYSSHRLAMVKMVLK